MVSKTLNGFRAVRYCDSRRIYYVIEREDGYVAISDDGAVRLLVELKAFPVTFCHEHNPSMPPVVRARFEGKPTFAEWWAAQQSAREER